MATNILESYIMTSPFSKEEECAKFTITDVEESFLLTNIATIGQQYAFSAWVKSDTGVVDIRIGGNNVKISRYSDDSAWAYVEMTFVATSVDLPVHFSSVDSYYIYHPQLELGNKATDWTPNPDDVDSSINTAKEEVRTETTENIDKLSESITASLQLLADSVVSKVTDENGNTCLTQSGTGWTYDITNLESTLSSVNDLLDELRKTSEETNDALGTLTDRVESTEKLQSYVRIGEINGKPCIELGGVNEEGQVELSLCITNTEMYFMTNNNTTILTTITNKSMVVDSLEVAQDLQMGSDSRTDGVWIWKQRPNGNLGLVWKGASS